MSAGDAGSAGADVGGAAGSAALDPWVTDESAWEPFSIEGTTFQDCTLDHAQPGRLPPGPQLTWTSCGDGCEQLDPSWIGGWPTQTGLGMVPVDGGVHPMMAATWNFPPYGVRRLIDLTDGSVKNAMRGRSTTGYPYPKHCNGGWYFSDPRYTSLAPRSPDGQTLDYSLRLQADGSLGGGGLRPKVQSGVSYFFNDALQGSHFIGAGSIQRIDLGGGPTEVIDSDVLFKEGAGQGKLAAWLVYDTQTNQKLRVWAPDGLGPRTLLDIPVDPSEAGLSFFLAMSDTRIVGRFATPSPEWSSAKTGLRVWHTAHTSQPGQATLTVSPPLPLPAGATEVGLGAHQTWGDYIAIQLFTQPGTQQSEGHTRLVHLPSWTSYTLLHGPDYQIGDPRGFTVSQSHVYIALRDKKEGLYNASIVRRYDLTKLAQTASAVQTP